MTTITGHELAQCHRANATGRPTVVFIHGLWLLPSSWERWMAVFEQAGFTALSPGWPDHSETGRGHALTIDRGWREVALTSLDFVRRHLAPLVLLALAALLPLSPAKAAAAEPIWDANTVEMVAVELGEGAFAFYPKNAEQLNRDGGAAATSGGLLVGRAHIDYLKAVRDQVAAAIAGGLTLEDTVAKVKLPEFGGYVLFGWVHPALNVPAAYRDLAGGPAPAAGAKLR